LRSLSPAPCDKQHRRPEKPKEISTFYPGYIHRQECRGFSLRHALPARKLLLVEILPDSCLEEGWSCGPIKNRVRFFPDNTRVIGVQICAYNQFFLMYKLPRSGHFFYHLF
jgi:hypothetical protein